METLSLDDLVVVLGKLRGVKDLEKNEDSLNFKYHDKDGDDVTTIVKLIDEERVAVVLPIPVPESYAASAMIVSSVYNSLKSSFGTFAYASVINGKPYIILESNICISGGVSEANLRLQVRNFIDKIDIYESVMLANIKELGPDSDFIRDSSQSELFRAVGQIAEGMLEAWVSR